VLFRDEGDVILPIRASCSYPGLFQPIKYQDRLLVDGAMCMEVPALLTNVEIPGVSFDPASTTFFLGRETLLATSRPGMAIWRERLFSWMVRNAEGAALYFRLPPNRVVELGAQIEL
jgi:K+ transporter